MPNTFTPEFVSLTTAKNYMQVVRTALSYALSNLDDLNEAADTDIPEHEIEYLLLQVDKVLE